jgi:hypothetical protein
MAQKPNKFLQLISGYLTGLVLVIVIIGVMTFLKHHH